MSFQLPKYIKSSSIGRIKFGKQYKLPSQLMGSPEVSLCNLQSIALLKCRFDIFGGVCMGIVFQKFGGAVSQITPEKSNKSMKNCLQLSI